MGKEGRLQEGIGPILQVVTHSFSRVLEVMRLHMRGVYRETLWGLSFSFQGGYEVGHQSKEQQFFSPWAPRVKSRVAVLPAEKGASHRSKAFLLGNFVAI